MYKLNLTKKEFELVKEGLDTIISDYSGILEKREWVEKARKLKKKLDLGLGVEIN